MIVNKFLKQLSDYAAGTLGRPALKAWVVQHLQEILDTGDAHAIFLVDQVDSLLIERGEGIISDKEFDETISHLVSAFKNTIVISYAMSRSSGAIMIVSGGSATVRKTIVPTNTELSVELVS
jgi:hypothetical protein